MLFPIFQIVKKECHSEPVRTLAHPRVASLALRAIHLLGIPRILELLSFKNLQFYSYLGDCHTSDIGHWFAMTVF